MATHETSRYSYIHEQNLATMVNLTLAGDTTKTVRGSKVKDSGVYEIEFIYSVRNIDTTTASSPHFYIGFGTFVDKLTTGVTHNTLVRLGADNNTSAQSYPNQRAVKVWLVKTNDTEMDFMCSEGSALTTWFMYNINAVAKKIADI